MLREAVPQLLAVCWEAVGCLEGWAWQAEVDPRGMASFGYILVCTGADHVCLYVWLLLVCICMGRPKVTCLHLPGTEMTRMCHHAWLFYVGSGIDVCIATILLCCLTLLPPTEVNLSDKLSVPVRHFTSPEISVSSPWKRALGHVCGGVSRVVEVGKPTLDVGSSIPRVGSSSEYEGESGN